MMRLGMWCQGGEKMTMLDGEHDFVRQLQRVLDSSHYIIYRLQQKRSDDIDVTVVGPTGIWVFEVKYWAGSIT